MQSEDIVKMKQEFQAKLLELEGRFEEVLASKVKERDEREVQLQKEFEIKLQEKEEELQEKEAENKLKFERLERACGLHYQFAMENFSAEKANNELNNWKSQAMYTHLRGYKFCIGIDANGYGSNKGKSVNAELWTMKGEYDDELKWPAKVKFTLELINHYPNGDNKKVTITVTWSKPDKEYNWIRGGDFSGCPEQYDFIKHFELPYNAAGHTHYLNDDTLCFIISDVTMQ